MDWRESNFDWDKAKVFLIAAEEGSLSAAARRLGTAQPTVGRQIAALEEELGVTLLRRIGRGVELTETGMALAEDVRAMGDAANRIALTASGQAQAIEGTVRITATETACAFYLPEILGKLRAREPGIRIELIASNSLSDLRKREADIALRSVRPTTPDLYARLVRHDVAHLYATTEYLNRVGRPRKAADFADLAFLGFEGNEAWMAGLRAAGFPVDDANFPLKCGSHLVLWEMTRQGLGIGVHTGLVGERSIGVERAAPFHEGFPFELWLVAHRELKTSRRIRLVFDFLAEEIVAYPHS